MVWHLTIGVLLLTGFGLLFGKVNWFVWAEQLLKRTEREMDDATRRRLLENRKNLELLRQDHSFRYGLERELYYSGLKRRFPFLTPELWTVGNLVTGIGILAAVVCVSGKWVVACTVVSVLGMSEWLLFRVLKSLEMRSVNENLVKLLNFLGNYSITAGEVTGIFSQISRYVQEPLKSALDECCYEAQTTGDAGMALLTMAEKIEHPKFKELAHNMEVSVRYCADFKRLVASSRRSVREYLRSREERKSMIREAVVSMAILTLMSVVALATVGALTEESMWKILTTTLPGRVGLGIIIGIGILLLVQVIGREG